MQPSRARYVTMWLVAMLIAIGLGELSTRLWNPHATAWDRITEAAVVVVGVPLGLWMSRWRRRNNDVSRTS